MTPSLHDIDLMRATIQLAADAARRGGRPFGAFVASSRGIIATGVDTSDASGDATDHAEIAALRAARASAGAEALAGCTLYASCEPCVLCTAAILHAGVRTVYYAAPRELALAAGYPDVVAADTARGIASGLTMRPLAVGDVGEPFTAAAAALAGRG